MIQAKTAHEDTTLNIKAHTTDTLGKLVRRLQKENKELRELLAAHDIPFPSESDLDTENASPIEYDPDQGSRIQKVWITDELAERFFRMFYGRVDVYAKRGRNGGYFPQCKNRWKADLCPKHKEKSHFCDEDCAFKQWDRLPLWRVKNHLIGTKDDCSDVIGVYPLFPDNTCRFLVFDFDNHEKDASKNDNANLDDLWKTEVDSLRSICKESGIDALTERSRSGRGAHVWIFFPGTG